MPRPKIADRSTIRTERISLVLPVSSYAGIKTLADLKGASVNDLLNDVIRRLVERNAGVIGDFEAARDRAADSLILDATG